MGGRISPNRTFAAALTAVAVLMLGVGASAAADSTLLSVADTSLTEGNSGSTSAVFQVTLSAASDAVVTVEYGTEDGSARAPDDYAATSGTLTFAPGETAKTIAVPVHGDALDEFHETFWLNLSSPTGAGILRGRAGAAILDDDPPPTVSVSDVTVGESDGAAAFRVFLSAPSGRDLTFTYATAAGTAAAPDDYAATSGRLWFAAGETEKTVVVSIRPDDVEEPTETFFVRLANPIQVAIADGEGLGTILDDDAPPPPEGEPEPPGDGEPLPPQPEDPLSPADDPPAPPANAEPDCSSVAPSGVRFWPPNHEFRTVALSGATDADGDDVTIEVVNVTQDEPTSRLGRGDRGPDAASVAGRPDRVMVRAERSGKGDGRAYRIEYVVSDGRGGECGGTVLVGVPHDARHRWHDSGSVYDSFSP